MVRSNADPNSQGPNKAASQLQPIWLGADRTAASKSQLIRHLDSSLRVHAHNLDLLPRVTRNSVSRLAMLVLPVLLAALAAHILIAHACPSP